MKRNTKEKKYRPTERDKESEKNMQREKERQKP
jgi:hypothetical protein